MFNFNSLVGYCLEYHHFICWLFHSLCFTWWNISQEQRQF